MVFFLLFLSDFVFWLVSFQSFNFVCFCVFCFEYLRDLLKLKMIDDHLNHHHQDFLYLKKLISLILILISFDQIKLVMMMSDLNKMSTHQLQSDLIYDLSIKDSFQTLDLYLPLIPTQPPSPILIYVHGGAWRSGECPSILF